MKSSELFLWKKVGSRSQTAVCIASGAATPQVIFSSANEKAGGALFFSEGSKSSYLTGTVVAGMRTYDTGAVLEHGLRSEWCIPPEGEAELCFGLEGEEEVGPLLEDVKMLCSMCVWGTHRTHSMCVWDHSGTRSGGECARLGGELLCLLGGGLLEGRWRCLHSELWRKRVAPTFPSRKVAV